MIKLLDVRQEVTMDLECKNLLQLLWYLQNLLKIGTDLTMDILGKIHNVEVIEDSPYDPNNNLIRV